MNHRERRQSVERGFLKEVLSRPQVRAKFKNTDPDVLILLGDLLAERFRTDEWEPTIVYLVDRMDPWKR